MTDARPKNDNEAEAASDREAERWQARHDRGLSVEEARAFACWRLSSPADAAEFDRLAGAWDAADLAKADPGLVARARQIDLETRRAQRVRTVRRTRLAWAGGLAAAAAITLAVLSPGRASAPAPAVAQSPVQISPAIQFVPSAARSQTLADGSTLELRDGSKAIPVYTATERRVRLIRGEAHFSVQKDATRPFVVEAAGLAVRAVGTAFNVRLDPAAVEVVVTEGTVSLHERHPPVASGAAVENSPAAPHVVAGQRAVVETKSNRALFATLAVEGVSPAQLEQAVAWHGARLVLQRAPLSDAIAAFNRYAGTKLELGEESLRARKLSGTFRSDNSEAFVRLLERAAEVRVEPRADGTVVLHPVR